MKSYTLSDGITIQEKPSVPSGYAGSSVSLNSISTNKNKPYRSSGIRAIAAAKDPRVEEFQPTNQNIQLGNYADPREAAYVASLFNSKPKLFMDNWNYRKEIKFPKDLYDLPVRSFEEIEDRVIDKAERSQQRQHDGIAAVRREPLEKFDKIEWKAFIQQHGIRGGQLLANMPNSTQEERTQSVQFISNLQKMNAAQALDALKNKGIDLTDQETLKKIQQSEVLSENHSLNESKQMISRIKMLAGLKK
jgi:hypothetical protein